MSSLYFLFSFHFTLFLMCRVSTSSLQQDRTFYMPWVCNKDAHPLAFSLSLGFKMMQQSPIGPVKSKHGAALCPCHRKRLDLFLRYRSDWPACDLCSALSLRYFPACITSRILYHRLIVSEIAFLKNGQKKTSKSFGTWRLDSGHFSF